MVGGVKSAWKGPVVGGGRRLMVDGITTYSYRTQEMTTSDYNKSQRFDLIYM